MKTPTWEPSQGSLVIWLRDNLQAKPVDLWTITLATGTVLRYSGADVPITVAAQTWGLGPLLQRSRVRQTIGVAVDTLNVQLQADDTVLVSGTPILQALAKGAFAGARVRLERAFLDDSNTCKGVVPIFQGRMGAIRAGRSGVAFDVRSDAELLDIQVPGDVYQPGCRNTVFDAHCGLSAAAFTVSGTTNAAGDATRRVLTSTTAVVTGKPAAWADLGVLTITSGANAGIARTVRTHALASGTATLTVVTPFPFAIASGTSFTLRAGCNKVKDGDCTTKFSNVARFRGEPYVPAPETVL